MVDMVGEMIAVLTALAAAEAAAADLFRVKLCPIPAEAAAAVRIINREDWGDNMVELTVFP